MVIVVTSDHHLGYESSDKAAFNAFLDQILGDTSVTHFVLLGDVVDMWRRDASGVFLENRDTFDRIAALSESVQVHYVAGNHDFHVLQLQDHSYAFDFVESLSLSEGGRNYRFVHGYQFDDLQQKPLMEALCRVMSDTAGDFETGAWATLTRDWSDLHYFISLLFEKRSVRKEVEMLQLPPKLRLAGTLGDVERAACSSVQAGEVLVFGHTHRPFINESGTVANAGSWVKDDPVHNTYVRLEAAGPRLFVFGGGEILDRVKC
jgi:UDP-2,3-diacylglucosamine pyrophosphatase LpxH